MYEVEAILIGIGLFSFIQFFLIRRYINSIFLNPTVKKAFSIIGTMGGETKRNTAVVQGLASDVLASPKFTALKMGADAMGFDFEGYVEKYGAVETLTGLNQLGGMLGIDVQKLLMGDGGPEQQSGGSPYLGGR